MPSDSRYARVKQEVLTDDPPINVGDIWGNDFRRVRIVSEYTFHEDNGRWFVYEEMSCARSRRSPGTLGRIAEFNLRFFSRPEVT